MKKTSTWVIIALSALLALVAYLYFTKKGPVVERKVEYWEKPDFKTIEKLINKRFSELRDSAFLFKVPPKEIHHYTKEVSNNKLQIDSLIKVINAMTGDTFIVDTQFITLYPEAPKLLSGLFKQNQFSLTTLNTKGEISTREYGVNYDAFSYKFLNDSLSASPLVASKAKSKLYFRHNLNIYNGYDFLNKNFRLGSAYDLYFTRLYVGGNTHITFAAKPQFGLEAKVGYRIF